MADLPPIYGPEAEPTRPQQAVRNASTPKPEVQNRPARRPAARSKGCGGCGGSRPRAAPRPNGWGPGSQLLKAFEAAGVPHCDECLALAGRMDRWGKRGCQRRLDQIVQEILPRARVWMKENWPWLHQLLALTRIEDAALAAAVRRKVERAIAAAPDRKPRRRRAGRKPRRRPGEFPVGKHWARSFRPGAGLPKYLSVEDLARDALSLIPRLPPGITQVIGSARSGLVPATLIAEMLHLPLLVVRNRQGDVVPAGNGWRLLEGTPKRPGTTLVVDDTTMTGNSLLRIKKILADASVPGPLIFATVYCNPAAANKPDLCAVDLPWPHLLEWNLFNSVLLDSFSLDFDGILCHDCPPDDDDDGPRYERFLAETRPLHLVRKRPAKLIVTARLERYRPHTLAWMDRWGVRAKELVMGPWPSIADRRRADVAAWKADTLKRFLKKRGGIPPRFYIESDARQAERIAQLAGSLVVCPAARKCYGKV